MYQEGVEGAEPKEELCQSIRIHIDKEAGQELETLNACTNRIEEESIQPAMHVLCPRKKGPPDMARYYWDSISHAGRGKPNIFADET